MEENQHLEEIQFTDFLKLGIFVGTVLSVRLNEKARQDAYVLEIDFGEMGIKMSSAQLTENYTPEDLLNSQVTAVLNFPAKRVAGIKSEVLVLAAVSENAGTVLLRPSQTVKNGSRVL